MFGLGKRKKKQHDKRIAKAADLAGASRIEASNASAVEAMVSSSTSQTASDTPVLDSASKTHSFGGHDYAKGKVLGKGAFGAVHKLDALDGSQPVALKTGIGSAQAEIAHEAKVLDTLGAHENILGKVLRRTPRPHPRPAFDGTSGAARTNEKAGEVTLAGLA
jgi:hypothetical protein